jgi:hypothetical protein
VEVGDRAGLDGFRLPLVPPAPARLLVAVGDVGEELPEDARNQKNLPRR